VLTVTSFNENNASDGSVGLWGHILVIAAALVSGGGWYFLDRIWLPDDPASKIAHAFGRTLLTLLPAFVAFLVASWRQRRTEENMAKKVERIGVLVKQYVRLRSVQNELETVDRLAKVARNATVQTGASASELFRAIEAVKDPVAKDLLLERYRHHTNSFVTLLSAVNEQLSESGRAISEAVTADDAINIIDRADKNAEDGLRYAEKIIQNRGIGEGLKVLNSTIEKARELQGAINQAVNSMQQEMKSLEVGGPQ
jgi:hypothetical protein